MSVGVFPQFVSKRPATITISEQIVDGGIGGFTVTNSGRIVIQCTRPEACGERWAVTDDHGALLFVLHRKKLVKWFSATENTGRDLFKVHKKVLSAADHPRCELTFTNAYDTKHSTLVLSGKQGLRDITMAGVALAQILEGEGRVNQLYEYNVDVEAGVDVALVACLCICSDEIEAERRDEGYTS